MLMAPSIATVDGATIWADDTSFFTFGLTSKAPRLRLDENGDPIFLMVQYALSDEEREANPDQKGGGYINFDATFSPTPEEEAAARAHLQPIVRAEWQRLKNGTPQEQDLPGVKGTSRPPDVVLVSPTWTSGNALMFAPQAEELISAQIGTAEPDLMAGNIAVFSMDTSPTGADFMRQTLLAGGAGSNLTPIQLQYTLGMMVRLPPVFISVTANAEQIYNETRQFMEGEGVDGCSTYDFQNTDMTTNIASLSGMIDVHIDPGSSQVDDDVLEELRQYALDMMQNLIESEFFTDDPTQAVVPGMADDIPIQVDPDPNAPTKKWLRKIDDTASIDLTLNLTQHSVVEWPINPQATLQTFFEGRSEAEMAQFIRRIRANDPFFQNLEIACRVFGSFDDTDLEAVELELHYKGRDEGGPLREDTQTFTFTSSDPQTWTRPLIGNEREVSFRWRSKMAGQDFGPFSTPERTSANELNLSIPDPGLITREVIAGDLNWSTLDLTSVAVTVRHVPTDPAGQPSEDTIILTQNATSGEFEADIGRDPVGQVSYKRRFAFADGEILEDDDWTDSASQTIIINKPFERAMEVRLLPVGDGWEEVVQVAVELFYDDGDGNTADDVVTLKTAADLRVWTVWLRENATQDFTYRVTASYKDGEFDDGEMQSGSGTGVVKIEVREPQETAIRIIPTRLNFDNAAITKVVLRHPATDTLEAFTFENHDPAEWRVPVRPSDPLHFTVEVTHFPNGGAPETLPLIDMEDPVVVLAPYVAPESGQLHYRFMPTLLNFEDTPLVTLDVKYEDEENGFVISDSFAFDDGSNFITWTIDVPDKTRKLLEWTATYFVAPDNAPQTDGPNFITTTLLPVPKFVPVS